MVSYDISFKVCREWSVTKYVRICQALIFHAIAIVCCTWKTDHMDLGTFEREPFLRKSTKMKINEFSSESEGRNGSSLELAGI